jgi:hypothetical protein
MKGVTQSSFIPNLWDAKGFEEDYHAAIRETKGRHFLDLSELNIKVSS